MIKIWRMRFKYAERNFVESSELMVKKYSLIVGNTAVAMAEKPIKDSNKTSSADIGFNFI